MVRFIGYAFFFCCCKDTDILRFGTLQSGILTLAWYENVKELDVFHLGGAVYAVEPLAGMVRK
jgi:hypothetical protein